jgi:aspartyl-tRNA(Asn)/glutamyl-tRNA(Gln) amidotransferase subunit A
VKLNLAGKAMSTNLHELPVHALSIGIAARRFSPVDVVEACLGRIKALEPKLHAFVHVHAAEARLAAEAADKAIRSGHAIGPLHGIPFASGETAFPLTPPPWRKN